MSLSRCLVALLVLLLSGCSSTPAEPECQRTVAVTGDGPVELLGRAPADDVDAWAARFDDHATARREACCSALIASAPDLALELFRRSLRSGDDRRASAIAEALARSGDSTPAASLAARRAAPDRYGAGLATLAEAEAALAREDRLRALERAKEAHDVFAELGDRLGADDAELVRLAAAPDDEPRACPAVPATAHEARVALVFAARARRRGDALIASNDHHAALRFAAKTRDAALVLEVEATRTTVGGSLDPSEAGAWLRLVAALALERKQPLIAFRCAVLAQSVDPAREGHGSLLAARAQIALGQASVALERTLAVVAAARSRRDATLEASAAGVAGEAFLALDRAGDAAGSFERAATLARHAGDVAGCARHSLNLARAHLLRGGARDARDVLDRLERRAAGDDRLSARVSLVRALELATREEYSKARVALERACALAAACGDYETVERVTSLRRRLGTLGT